MVDDATERVESEAVDCLEELGFTEYEAYTFVHLLRLGVGTARDVAELGEVPRTRVYEAAESLHEAGLVDVQYTTPRKYSAVSRETAVRKLDLERQNVITELDELLNRLEPTERTTEELGVWTVTGRDAVASRVLEFVEDAEETVVYVTVDELLTDAHVDRLAAANDRGVDLYLGGISADVEGRITDHVPSATRFETLWKWSEEEAGSLLVVDERTALVSAVVDEGPDATEEVAIWGSGERNSLVVMLRAIFTWRLRDGEIRGSAG
jgi:sugar-specific transcriptional regulator TrmB